VRLAPRVAELGTESAFTVLARARELEAAGRDVAHLEIGEPGFETPDHVREAAIASLRAGETHYGPAAGLPELREVAAAHLSRTRSVEVEPTRVLVATGAKPFLFFTVLATSGPGDEVILPDPGFPIYASAVRWAGARPVPLPLREEHDFAFDPDELAALLTPRTRLVILNSPQNPTGGVVPADRLEAVAELLAGTDAWLLSDEVYARLTYEGSAPSPASVDGMLDRTILLDGFSKTFAMTGWRCGFACVPQDLVEPLTRFFVNSTSCVPTFVQRAGVAALEGPQEPVARMLAALRERRDLVVAGLRAIDGVSCRMPRGAFYAFPNVSALGVPDDVLATRLLEEAGVALLAGSAFGSAGAGHLRVSYGTAPEVLEEALARLAAFVAALR
jgi:aspartate aminotransferase